MKKTFFGLFLAFAATVLLTSCNKEEWTVNIESGKFVLVDEPYKHPYAGNTIRAIIYVEENDGVASYDRPFNITGNVPQWAKSGDTVIVNAVLQEKYPRGGIILTEANNVTLYEIKKISKIK